MVTAGRGRAWLLAAGAVLATAVARPAAACSGPLPRSDLLAWSAAGDHVTALLAPDGRLVTMTPDGRAWTSWHLWRRFADRLAGLSADGSTVVALTERYDTESGSCVPESVEVRAIDVRTGRTTGLGELVTPDSEAVDVLVSPTGRRVAVRLLADEAVVEILDVVGARHLGTVEAPRARWLDDDRLVVGSERALWVVRAPELVEVARAARPAGGLELVAWQAPGRRVHALEVRDGATALLTGGLEDGGALHLEPRPWPSEPRPSTPRWIADDGGLLVRTHHEAADEVRGSVDNVVEVVEVPTGRVLWHVTGQGVYTAAALSPDGRLLALVAHEPTMLASDGCSPADPPATLEIVDLATGGVVGHGAAVRSRAAQGAAPR